MEYRPLPRIIARAMPSIPPPPTTISKTKFGVGSKVKIYITPPKCPAFWREYEVAIIDGDRCRLETRNKKFVRVERTEDVKNLFNDQQQLKSDQNP